MLGLRRGDDMKLLAILVLALSLAGCSVMRPALQAMVDRLEDSYAPTRGGRMYIYGENSIEVWTSGKTIVGIRELHDGVPYEWGDVGGEGGEYSLVDDWTPENWRRARWDAGAVLGLCVYGTDGTMLCPPGE